MNRSENLSLEKVWRYLSFSRFVWLLQKRQLWLSRTDLLGDSWEMALAGDQLKEVIRRHPPIDINNLPLVQTLDGVQRKRHETAMERAERILRLWRRRTFVNCWSASEYESHALWRIYCGSREGVAIQTTFGKLLNSVDGLPIYRVVYEIPGKKKLRLPLKT